MLRLPHNRKTRIQFALVIAFVAAFYFGARNAAEWLRSDEDFLNFEHAIERGDIDEVRRMLKDGVSPNVRNSATGRVPLHVAVAENNRAILELLFDFGANPNRAEQDSLRTPLHLALEEGRMDLAEVLLDKGARVDVVDDDNVSPLHRAVARGNMDLVRRMVLLGAPLRASSAYSTDFGWETPACWALEYGHIDIAIYILFEAGEGDFSEENVDLLLLDATRARSTELMETFLDAGANPNAPLPGYGGSAMGVVLLHGYAECLQLLLERGAKVDESLWYFAMYLIGTEDTLEAKSEMLSLLVRKGGDINVLNERGDAMLHAVVQRGGTNAIRILVEHGADINVQTSYGQTPLHFAAQLGWAGVVDVLLECGADPDIPNNFNELPIDLVRQSLNDPQPESLWQTDESETPDYHAVIDLLERHTAIGENGTH